MHLTIEARQEGQGQSGCTASCASRNLGSAVGLTPWWWNSRQVAAVVEARAPAVPPPPEPAWHNVSFTPERGGWSLLNLQTCLVLALGYLGLLGLWGRML